MNNNYLHIVEDSQFYTELSMIKESLTHLATKLHQRNEKEEFENVKYIIKGIENTIEKGYKLVENGQ